MIMVQTYMDLSKSINNHEFVFLIIVRVANDDNLEHFVVVFDYKNNKFIIDN